MMLSPNVIEAILMDAYRRAGELYGRALPLVEQLLAQPENENRLVEEILRLLEEVRAIHAEAASAQQQWREDQLRPGAEFQALLDQVAELIRQLADRMQHVERRATGRKEQLVPQLDAAIRGQRMRRAYGGHYGLDRPA